jgi:exopolysaccharide biosynthesis predicted pyruvyltransferase EpsI
MVKLPLRTMSDFLLEYRDKDVLYFPNPGNAGDGLIAAATYQAFRRADVRFTCIDVSADVRGKTVFLGGGGNLIPLYPNIREAIETFTAREAAQIILLPHTIRGNEDVLSALPKTATIFCRDPESYLHVIAHTNADVHLDHDMAFHIDLEEFYSRCSRYSDLSALFHAKIGTMGACRSGLIESASFLREDIERSASRGEPPETNMDISNLFTFGVWPDSAEKSTWCLFEAIRRSQHVTTDRLHVGISCGLLSHPCTLHDNSYGKNRTIYLHSLKRFASEYVTFEP